MLNNSAVYVHKFGQIEYFYAYDMTFGPTLTIVIYLFSVMGFTVMNFHFVFIPVAW